MMMTTKTIKFATGLLILILCSFSQTTLAKANRGLAWGVNNAWAPTIGKLPLITWYHHWQLPSVPQMPKNQIQYVPTNWGPKYYQDWLNQVNSWNCSSLPQYILAFNEPDVPSQSNMTPLQAANAFMDQLQPFREMGVKVSSPQLAWNFTWMNTFLTELRLMGGDVDFIALHYYGSWNSMSNAQWYITQAWKNYKLPIWVTEIGTTNSSNGTNTQVRQFMVNFLNWLDSLAYVNRVAWTGCYSLTSPPDDYISKYTSFFFSDGTLRQIGNQYGCNKTTC